VELAGPGAPVHARCFEQIWLFEGTPHEALCTVAKKLVRKKLDVGEDLFRQGDNADSIYLIKVGARTTLDISGDWEINGLGDG
jgi:CRP/FNR family transcriptional regulator